MISLESLFSFESSSSSSTKSKIHLSDAFFKENVATKIASEVKSKYDGNLSKAINALNSQLNREKKHAPNIQDKIRLAITILRNQREKETSRTNKK